MKVIRLISNVEEGHVTQLQKENRSFLSSHPLQDLHIAAKT